MPVSPWILAARPRTLVAAIAPLLPAIALVWRDQVALNALLVLWLVVATTSIQIATNLFNDAIDYMRGADQQRIGPTRVSQAGLLDHRSVLKAGYAMLGAAVLAGIPLVMQGGWPIFLIGVLALFFAYAYTGGPLPLAYLGLGEVFVLLFFGLIAVTGSYWVLALHFSTYSLLAGAQLGCLSVVLLLVNNIRDLESDRAANKRTIATRLGRRGALYELAAFLAIPYLLAPFWLPYSEPAAWLPCLTLPLACGVQLLTMRAKDTQRFGEALSRAARLLLLFAVLLTVAIISF
ncbi:MAG: 1,4-dihydroxy-2-naphthoate octaprenyltransferase [Bdellovibrionota bacterium]|nr:MAG: 1,4-dihydroxy-2-naphthoate octaprenyltransferase [Bdellovibrionota bacterium]